MSHSGMSLLETLQICEHVVHVPICILSELFRVRQKRIVNLYLEPGERKGAGPAVSIDQCDGELVAVGEISTDRLAGTCRHGDELRARSRARSPIARIKHSLEQRQSLESRTHRCERAADRMALGAAA